MNGGHGDPGNSSYDHDDPVSPTPAQILIDKAAHYWTNYGPTEGK